MPPVMTTLTRSDRPVGVTAAAIAFVSPSSSSSLSGSRKKQRRTSVSPTSVSASEETCGVQPSPSSPQKQQHLVLIGGGHAHVQVLKALHRGIRPPHLQVTLIDRVTSASYSGMVPGCIAGHYTVADTQLQLVPLVDYSDIQWIHGTVVDIDLQRKLIHLAAPGSGRDDESDTNHHPNTPVPFDVLSIDIGSTSRGYTSCPGAMPYTIPTRPIDQLIYKLDMARQHELEQQQQQHAPEEGQRKRRLVVIGGGIAGIELAMTITSRWEKDRIPFDTCTILDAGDSLLPHENEYARNVARSKLQSKHIEVQYRSTVTQIDELNVYTKLTTTTQSSSSNDEHIIPIPYTHCIWSTGAGAHALSKHLYHQRQLDCDPNTYWIRVHPTLQSTSHPYVFAAGDCCTIVVAQSSKDVMRPSPPKAGVYAVRSGPILIENLTRYLESIRTTTATTTATPTPPVMTEDSIPTLKSNDELTLLEYQPQDDFLKLLVCGDGTAIGFRFGLVLQGEWVFRLKDDIDQSFMKLFDVSGLVKPIYDTEETLLSSTHQVTGKYNTQQYDSNLPQNAKTVTMSPNDAASILRRTDNDVNIDQVRLILSNMGNDMTYRNAVVDSFHHQQDRQPVPLKM